VDVPKPVRWTGHRPIRQPIGGTRGVSPPPQTRPTPQVSFADQPRAQCVTLDVAADGEKVAIILNRKRLEPCLVEMTGSHRAMVRMPAHRMGVRQPAYEVRQLAVLSWPDHQVPVSRHEAKAQKSHRCALQRRSQGPFERGVVAKRFKESHPRNRAVQYVVRYISYRTTRFACHLRQCVRAQEQHPGCHGFDSESTRTQKSWCVSDPLGRYSVRVQNGQKRAASPFPKRGRSSFSAQIDGHAVRHGRSCSYCAATCSSRSSRRRGATSWSPTGSLSSLNPARSETAGLPEKLNG